MWGNELPGGGVRSLSAFLVTVVLFGLLLFSQIEHSSTYTVFNSRIFSYSLTLTTDSRIDLSCISKAHFIVP